MSSELRMVVRVPRNKATEALEGKVESLLTEWIGSETGIEGPRPVVQDTDACPSLLGIYELRGPEASINELLEQVEKVYAANAHHESIDFQVQAMPVVGDPPVSRVRLCEDLIPPPGQIAANDSRDLRLPALADQRGTPHLGGVQGYLQRAARDDFGGVDAAAAWRLPGGLGDGVRIVDIELGWSDHQDLETTRGSRCVGSRLLDDRIHGVAVEGIVRARQDRTGIDGLAPGATFIRKPVSSPEPESVSQAICSVLPGLEKGDVILLETQYQFRPKYRECYTPLLPHETCMDGFAAIVEAVNKGIHVVQAAGNGRTDIDCYLRYGTDSGSIVVASGQPSNGRRMPRSNFGERVNLFSWGDWVATLGLGKRASNLWPGLGYEAGKSMSRRCYRWFTGTSAAAAIVAGCVACLSGILRKQGRELPPEEMRRLLVGTGYEKAESTGMKIGVHPDLRAACEALEEGAFGAILPPESVP